MSTAARSSNLLRISAPLGYTAALAAVAIAWSLRNENLIRAEDGIGYLLGIAGGSLMLLLLIYPLRKRSRGLALLGSVGFWFRVHMVFGILGPVLVLFHSNFQLGSLNGRVALFCTLIVAGSGLMGRYLYAKIHYGLYGHRATLTSLRADLQASERDSDGLGLIRLIDDSLQPHEARALERARGVLPSVLGAMLTPLTVTWLRGTVGRRLKKAIGEQARRSPVIADHRQRLLANARDYLNRRLITYRKLAQLSGCERLFSLWHIVHFPLFLVMVAAAIIHVVAVHAY